VFDVNAAVKADAEIEAEAETEAEVDEEPEAEAEVDDRVTHLTPMRRQDTREERLSGRSSSSCK